MYIDKNTVKWYSETKGQWGFHVCGLMSDKFCAGAPRKILLFLGKKRVNIPYWFNRKDF